MLRLGRDEGDAPWAASLAFAGDGDFELVRDDVPDFFLLMAMTVNIGVLIEVPPDKGVAGRMEDPAAPARPLVEDVEF